MMAQERLSVFGDTGDVDLSAFTPTADMEEKRPKPPREKVKAVSEAAQFPSREPSAPAAGPLRRKPRYHKTGRTASLSCRLMPSVVDQIYEIADRENWLVGETIERGIEALERELGRKRKGEGTHGS
jgi:hypothetical protein